MDVRSIELIKLMESELHSLSGGPSLGPRAPEEPEAQTLEDPRGEQQEHARVARRRDARRQREQPRAWEVLYA